MEDILGIFLFGYIYGDIKKLIMELAMIYESSAVSLISNNKSEEKVKKKEYYKNVKHHIVKLNKEIKFFNDLRKKHLGFLDCQNIEKVDLMVVKKIIYEHKAIYQDERKETIEDYILARGDSASSLSRRNTHLKLMHTLVPVEQSAGQFIKEMNNHMTVFKNIKKLKVRKKVKKIIRDAEGVYSFGAIDVSVFLIGKCLELSLTDYLLALKRNRKIKYANKEIESWNFETKINTLKREKLILPSRYSKIMSVKWDRNIFGHPSKYSEEKEAKKDPDAIIKIGINSIELFESKIQKLG